MAGHGFVEVRSYPFGSAAALDDLGLAPDDERRRALRLANPLSDEDPLLRTTLLPGLLATTRRNVGRGCPDLAVFESGRVLPATRRRAGRAAAAGRRAPDRGRARCAGLGAARTSRYTSPWYSPALGRPAGGGGRAVAAQWADAVDLKVLAGALDVQSASGPRTWPRGTGSVRPRSWWGTTGGSRVRGECIHGSVRPWVCRIAPARRRSRCHVLTTHRAPLDRVPVVSAYPGGHPGVALVVAGSVPAAEVQDALTAGAGPLLESIRLFDVFEGEQSAPGRSRSRSP